MEYWKPGFSRLIYRRGRRLILFSKNKPKTPDVRGQTCCRRAVDAHKAWHAASTADRVAPHDMRRYSIGGRVQTDSIASEYPCVQDCTEDAEMVRDFRPFRIWEDDAVLESHLIEGQRLRNPLKAPGLRPPLRTTKTTGIRMRRWPVPFYPNSVVL